MRMPPLLNWLLLCVNAVLTFVLLVAFLQNQNRLGPFSAPQKLSEEMRGVLGMDIYYEIGPFLLMTNCDFPRGTDSFIFAQKNQSLSISVLDNDVFKERVPAKSLNISIDSDFDLSCDYSSSNGDTQVYQWSVRKKKNDFDETLTDLNVDGVFDMRHIRNTEKNKSCIYVWYENAWQEIMGGDKDPKQDLYHKTLSDGQDILFDKQIARWLPVTKASAPPKKESKQIP